MSLATILSFMTVLCLAAWVGEVATLNLIVVPNLNSMEQPDRAPFLSRFFPGFFRLATVFAISTIAFGAAAILSADRAARPVTLIGGALVLVLALFHFVIESRLTPVARSLASNPEPGKVRFMMRFLNIVPRIGIVVIVSGFALLLLGLSDNF